jgi:hypothetical protein
MTSEWIWKGAVFMAILIHSVIGFFFVLFALMYAADWILSIVFTPKNLVCMQIIPLTSDCARTEQLLRWGYANIRWSRWCRCGQLIALDCGADEHVRKIAEAFCRGRSAAFLCTGDELCEMIENKEICKSLHIVLY